MVEPLTPGLAYDGGVASASLKNQFLLAMPNPESLSDYFGDTITYICRHNREGAFGLVVNRPLEMTVGDMLQQLNLPCDFDAAAPVIEGGPVRRDCAFILHTDDVRVDQSLGVGNGLALTTEMELLAAIAGGGGPRHYLLALGYAGWGPGQLEGELERDVWLTCPSSKSVIFDVPFKDRVSAAAKIIGIDFSLMSGKIGHA